MKKVKRIVISVFTFPLVYFLISLGLIYWPLPTEQSIYNGSLDFSSLSISAEISSGIEKTYRAKDNKAIYYRDYPAQADIIVILIHGSSAESRYLSKLFSVD